MKYYRDCISPSCGGIYKITESNNRQLCRKCREAEIAREIRIGIGEPPVMRAGGGYRVVRDAEKYSKA